VVGNRKPRGKKKKGKKERKRSSRKSQKEKKKRRRRRTRGESQIGRLKQEKNQEELLNFFQKHEWQYHSSKRVQQLDFFLKKKKKFIISKDRFKPSPPQRNRNWNLLKNIKNIEIFKKPLPSSLAQQRCLHPFL